MGNIAHDFIGKGNENVHTHTDTLATLEWFHRILWIVTFRLCL